MVCNRTIGVMLLIASVVAALLVAACPLACAVDLTGRWSCDDGGAYYIHQIGNTIWWFGGHIQINVGNTGNAGNIRNVDVFAGHGFTNVAYH